MAAKQHRSPVDRSHRFDEMLADLARENGLEPWVLHEEWGERAMARQYADGTERDEAERLAFDDVLERFRV